MDKYSKPQLITIPTIENPMGDLSFIEKGSVLPFEPQSVSWTVRPGAPLPAPSACRTAARVIFAIAGSVSLSVDNGVTQSNFTLSNPAVGLYVPPMTWLTFSLSGDDPSLLTLSSKLSDSADIITDYQQFKTSLIDETF